MAVTVKFMIAVAEAAVAPEAARPPAKVSVGTLVAVEVLRFLKACHSLDILFVDVKPSNFCPSSAAGFVNRHLGECDKANLKAIDFGCSQSIGEAQRQQQQQQQGCPEGNAALGA